MLTAPPASLAERHRRVRDALAAHRVEALVLTHLLALGYLAMVMLGAFTQMAPVAAGAPLPGVGLQLRKARRVGQIDLPPLLLRLR